MAQAYSGSLQTKKKAELQEIAVALHISDKGTKEDVQVRIKKYLDENPSLEGDPVFSGLFVKRKRSLQPQLQPSSRSVPSSATESTGEVVVKTSDTPKHTRSSRRFNALDTVREGTPLPDAREVSMMLKNPPLSPEEPSSLVVNAQTPAREGEARAITSTPKSILRNIPKSSVELATSSFKKLRTDTEQTANQLLFTSRLILSNSINIWLISVLVELVYILRVSVPWKRVDLLPLQSHGVSLSIHYAPLATFQSPTFWTILVHWAIPSVIIPVISGSLVSFHPANSPAARMRRARFFDPLTASVMRVAAQYAYPYEALKLSTECVDVLGPHWRLLIASVAAALTFAEAIATAPAAYAEAKLRPRGTPRRAALLEETAS